MSRRASWIAFSAAILVLMPLLTARGRVGGDELEVFGQLNHFYSTGLSLWGYFESKPVSWLAHRLYWFLQQYAVVSVVNFGTHLAGVPDNPFFQQYAVSYSQSLFAWAGMLLCGWYAVLRLKLSYSQACMAVAMVWLTGYGILFLIGNYIETTMLFLVACRLFLFRENTDGRSHPLVVLGLVAVDFLLFAIKPYSIIFTALTLPLALRSEPSRMRFVVRYAFGMLALIILWELVIFIVANNYGYNSFPWDRTPTAILERFFHSVFSFTFGLAWSFPALWFLLSGWRDNGRPLAFKLAALLALQLFFCTLPFWHGGMAGGRYLFPFLLFLLPEIVHSFQGIAKRLPSTNLLVVLACLLTLPTIDYRNTNSSEYYNQTVIRGVSPEDQLFLADTYPLYDYSLHPVVFAWRVVYAKVSGEATVKVSESVPAAMPIDAIYPMTGLSRIIYLLEVRPPIGENALRILESKGAASLGFWKGLRFFSVLLVILGILHCALKEMRKSSRVRETP